jgi:hydroxyacylglutathione hydrolase
MPADVVAIPCLTDNFAYLVHDAELGRTACIDVPEAAPVLAELARRGWLLSDILLTHHHGDHVQGAAALAAATGARITGAAADAHRLPPLDGAVTRGDLVHLGRVKLVVRDAAGHTRGHIAFHAPREGLLFTGDSLMAAGCGRLFEGSAAEMWATLSAFAALPGDTRVFSGHDYLAGNLRFAAQVDPDNPAVGDRRARVEAIRAAGGLPMPSTIAEERATNPFLRADLPALRAAAGLPQAPAVEVFAALRAMKDRV